MAGLIPFNRKKNSLSRTGFADFYNMLDDFFTDRWMPSRNLLGDTFKIDVKETDNEYIVEAELPGIQKEEITLSAEDESLSISVNREESVEKESKDYIHKERRTSSMSRSIHLVGAKPDEIKAKLEDGVLTINIPKEEKASDSLKIDIE